MPATSSRTAFVTGASAGLGQAFARRLLAEGFQVWGTAREISRLAEVFADAPQFHPVALDLADASTAVAAYTQAANAAGGAFAVVVNNAGYGVFGEFAATDFSVWRDQLDAMLMTQTELIHAQLRDLRRAGRGTLVNVASLATEFPLPYMTGYNMAKAAMSALSESLMQETAGESIAVIDFRPGDYRTRFNQVMPGALSRETLPPRQQAAWSVLEANLARAPLPERAAADLWRAVRRGRSGRVRSGDFFQTMLAPLFQRLAPTALARVVRWRYFGLR